MAAHGRSCVDGLEVPREQWMHTRPRHGQLIEVRSVVGKAVIPWWR